jgi:hypothetical protein
MIETFADALMLYLVIGLAIYALHIAMLSRARLAEIHDRSGYPSFFWLLFAAALFWPWILAISWRAVQAQRRQGKG